MSSLRRRIDRILSQGEGRQLAWLAGLALTLFLILCLVGSIWALGWTEILNLYLDPGSYPLEAKSGSQTSLNFFSLLIAFGGILVLNALTVSAFSNVFENISSAYAEGRKRYPFKGHVLILGADASLERMLEALRDGESWAGREIVVMTTGETEQLRQQLSGILADRRFGRKLTFYNGDWTSAEGLSSARADRASVIYICGEKDSSAHDDSCVRCYEALREICSGEGAPIRCYMKMRDRSTLDVFRFLGTDPQCRLETEVVGTADYLAEQLLVETGFLPAFGAEDPRRLHLVVCGTAELSEAVALVASQLCHYPSWGKAGRTRITFVGEDVRALMDDFTAAFENIFTLSHWQFVSAEGVQSHAPDEAFGDFLDVEWAFVEGGLSSPPVRRLLEESAGSPDEVLRIAICHEDSQRSLSDAIHLSRKVLESGTKVAVCQQESCAILDKARQSRLFEALVPFGEAVPGHDILLTRRSLRGARVNYAYDKVYGNPPAPSEDKAWFPIPLPHKLSSIASAASIPLKLRSFGIEASRESIESLSEEQMESLSEVEHRRWMATALVLGYRALPKAERADRSEFKRLKNEEFIHLDIAPYDEIAGEAAKDTVIVKEIPYIMG